MQSTFKPSENMTFQTVQGDCQKLVKFCSEAQGKVLMIDLSKVRHCDSAGLALLIEAKRLSIAHDKTCEITGISDAIKSLAEFCGVGAMLGLIYGNE